MTDTPNPDASLIAAISYKLNQVLRLADQLGAGNTDDSAVQRAMLGHEIISSVQDAISILPEVYDE